MALSPLPLHAVLSADGLFRYRLERWVQEQGLVIAYFGVNPSTADASVEDQTTRKWRGFTLRNGGRAYIAGNPFAYRAKDVRALASAPDAVGPDNDEHIDGIITDADVLVPCWGSRDKLPRTLHPRLDQLADKLSASGKPVKVFGLSASGDPLHPLTLGYDRALTPWARAAA